MYNIFSQVDNQLIGRSQRTTDKTALSYYIYELYKSWRNNKTLLLKGRVCSPITSPLDLPLEQQNKIEHPSIYVTSLSGVPPWFTPVLQISVTSCNTVAQLKYSITCRKKNSLWQYCDWSAQRFSHCRNLPVGQTKAGHTLVQMQAVPWIVQSKEHIDSYNR